MTAVADRLSGVLFDLLVKTNVPVEEYGEFQRRIALLYDLATDGCEHNWQYDPTNRASHIPERCLDCLRTRWRIPK